VGDNAAMEAEPKRPVQFSLRTLFVVMTAIGIFFGASLAFVRWGNELVMNIERDAARERVLRLGTETEYDHWLIGNEVDSLKAQHQRNQTQPKQVQ
jgi:hypothetical protein